MMLMMVYVYVVWEREHAYAQRLVLALDGSRWYLHTYIHAYIHTCIHTYLHTFGWYW